MYGLDDEQIQQLLGALPDNFQTQNLPQIQQDLLGKIASLFIPSGSLLKALGGNYGKLSRNYSTDDELWKFRSDAQSQEKSKRLGKDDNSTCDGTKNLASQRAIDILGALNGEPKFRPIL